MNVFVIKYVGGYGGGMALVAAEDEDEAFEYLKESDTYVRHAPQDYEVTECIEELQYYGGPGVIISSFYIE